MLASVAKSVLFMLAVSTMATALSACATPRDRSQPQSQPQPAVERQPTPAAEAEEQSELAELTGRARSDASPVTGSKSFEMSGTGDAEAIHELAAGLYQCNIDIQGNEQGGRAALFRIQLPSREPLHPAVLSTTQSSWSTTFELLLSGSEQTASSSVEVMMRAAPTGSWALQCDRRAELVRSGTDSRGAIQLSMPASGEPRGNVGISSGRGSGIAMVSAIPDVYTCQIAVGGNFAADGQAGQFLVKLGERVLVDVLAIAWSGEVEYELIDEGGVRPTLDVTAADSASWDVVCSPKTF